MSSEKNLYEILEIHSSATAVMIKSAYRKLARKYHPDLNSGDMSCIEKFKEISEAYEILSNADKKKNYDILRGFYQETSRARYNEAGKAYKEAYKETDEEKQARVDSREMFSNVLNDILDGFKKTTSSSRQQNFKTKRPSPERGTDVFSDVLITMSESIHGTTRTINILHTQACANCDGRPFVNDSKCPVCKGLGEQAIHKKLTVKIPQGVKHGSKIRIANEGNKGYNGGRNGDLYLNIKIESDSKFQYDGLNVLCSIPIAPFEAVLGASIEIPTVSGKVSMKITPNTQSGQKFRLAGQGIAQNGKKGDMIVTVNIEVPQKPTKEEIELYKKIQSITKTNVRENK